MPILTSSKGQRYAVDTEFDLRLDAWDGIDYIDYDGDNLIVKGSVADLLDFFEAEGVI